MKVVEAAAFSLDKGDEQHIVFVNEKFIGSVVKAAAGAAGFALRVLVDGDGVELERAPLFGAVRIFHCGGAVVPTETLGAFLERYGKTEVPRDSTQRRQA